MLISDWSSEWCSSDLLDRGADRNGGLQFFRCSFGGRAEARQRGVNAPDHIGKVGDCDTIVRDVRRDNIGGAHQKIFSAFVCHYAAPQTTMACRARSSEESWLWKECVSKFIYRG